jgi:N-acylglucosamine-6-phosphate 2-epimerase
VVKLKKSYPNILLMADIATIEDGLICAEIGFDILSSTLSGYTHENLHIYDGPDYEIVKELKTKTDCYVNAEGRIWELSHLDKVMEMGADTVTIGSAITYPHLIAERFNTRFVENRSKFYL